MIIEILLFLVGVHLAVELTAAAYRVVDLWYCLGEHAAAIAMRLAGWGLAIALLQLLLPGRYAHAVSNGLIFFLIFHIVIYWIGQLLRFLQNRPSIRLPEAREEEARQ